MKKVINLFLILSLAISCTSNSKELVRSSSEFKVLDDEIMTAFPGGIYLIDENIAWYDPFASESFIHCLNKDTGEKIGSFGSIGQGPSEYISPYIHDIPWNNNLYVVDDNGNNRGYFNIEHQKENKGAFIKPTSEDSLIRSKGYNTRLDDNLYLGINNEGKAFKLYSNGIENTFGEYMLKNEVANPFLMFRYNTKKKILVVSSTGANYFAGYKLNNNNFELLWEIREENYKYENQNGYISFDRTKSGASEMALTKDFIVTLQRDYENDNTDESTVGRDFSKNPQTLFVYNYTGDLLKIIDYGVSIGRIVGDVNNNNVYAIFVDPDFKLGYTSIK